MGFWYKRTQLEKKLIQTIVLLILLSIGLIIGLIVVNNKIRETQICETKECLMAAAELQSSLDTNADPCEDFHQYACGGWINNNIMGTDRSRWAQTDVTEKTLIDKLRVILDSEVKVRPSNSLPVLRKTITFYNQCLNLTKRNSDGIKELKELVPLWPMLNRGYLNQNYDWTSIYAKYNRDYGFNFILSNAVDVDQKNTSIYSLYVAQTSLGVGRSQLINPEETNNKKILDAYKTFIKETVLQFVSSYSELDKHIEDMIDFEKSLAIITTEPSLRRNKTLMYGNKTTLKEFNQNYHGLPNLIDIEKQVFENIPEVRINAQTPLIVYDKGYFARLGQVLRKTDNKTIANYLSWRTVKWLGYFTTTAMEDINFKFDKVLTGVDQKSPHWEECLESVNAKLKFSVGRLYVDKHFSKKSKKDINQMIDELSTAFKQLLRNENNWMESKTKIMALKKLDHIHRAIGFPDFIMNNRLLEEYYQGFECDSHESYLKTISSHYRWSVHRWHKKLNTIRKEFWFSGPAVVNAYNNANENGISFPAGILQSPFYTLGLPVSLNLGAIGSIIGHEITHSFDDSGSQYDEYGNLYNWWDDSTKQKFQNRIKCFKDQYNSYYDSIAGRFVNGNLTIGENIADNGGLRQAFRALENYRGVKQLLPASMKSFTNEQLFFISFAKTKCQNIRKEALVEQIETSFHSPGKYRVWGAVSNMESFSKAFNCKTDSKMNPKSKCIIW